MDKKIKAAIIFIGVFAATSITAFTVQRYLGGKSEGDEHEEEDTLLDPKNQEQDTESTRPAKVVAAKSSTGNLAFSLFKMALQPTRFLQTQLPLWKDSIQKIQSHVIQQSIFFSLLLASLLLALFFISLLAAFWLNEVLASNYWGFGIVGGTYLFICLILYLSKGKSSPPKLEKGSEETPEP